MGSFLRQHPFAVGLSALLHVLLAAALTAGFDPSGRRRAAVPGEQVAIQATVVDESLIQAELERLERLEQEELQRQQEAARLAQEQAEAARREREEEERRLEAARQQAAEEARQEEVRLAELQRQREEEATRQRQEAEESARQEQERLAALERQRQEAEEAEEAARREQERLAELERQRQAEEERRRQAAARQQAEMEAELQRALAAEDERRRAEEAGLLDEYIRLIENRIQQNWIPPASATAGLECVVNVTQIPSGDVVDVRIGRCNGDEAVVRSIEAAVLRSSPLPRPPIPSLFERNLEVVFNPEV